MAALTSSTSTSTTQAEFIKLKAVCVPLLGASRLTPASIAATSQLLENLIKILDEIPSENLSPNTISYVFLPLSTILQRNSSADIPDQILEKVLIAFKILVESWWWTFDMKVWEQIFMLCGSVVGGIEAKPNGKGKSRDDETKEAAMRCLVALLRPRSPNEALGRSLLPSDAEDRLFKFQEHSQNPKFIPVIGQTLDSIMTSSTSQYLASQCSSLEVASFLLDLYLPDPLIPSVLPGVVSTMTKICLALPQGKGWANGEVVNRGLKVMQTVILKAIGDDVCIKHGVLRRIRDLDELIDLGSSTESKSPPAEIRQYGTRRTESWLRGTATQLHIAINGLTPLLTHPTPTALQALSTFSASLIRSTALTLPQTQPLLMTFLLSLSLSDYPSVSSQALHSLFDLLATPSDAQIPLQRTLMTNLADNLSALPRLLSTQSDARVAHVAGLIDAVCRLATLGESQVKLSVVSKGIGKLLGPTGGIEKWGWSLLSVLEFVEPPVIVTTTSGAQLALEINPESPDWINFPELIFKNISSHEARDSLRSMLHSLGKAGEDSALFSVDWFISLGSTESSTTSVAALWCACRLLEGIAEISLFGDRSAALPSRRFSKRLERYARTLAKDIAEIWDRPDPSFSSEKEKLPTREEETLLIQHQTGLIPLHETLKITQSSSTQPTKPTHQPVIHRALCLQLIAVTAGISQGRFSSLFIHTLYPVLHSLVSPVSFLSSTALATLNFITTATSYASPANLLLSNFDYILDSIARRLSQRWLDIDASKVLGVMVRLVGANIVERAGDVVEECFDRLDEFHGYGVIVDGLIDVLTEVIKVVESETLSTRVESSTPTEQSTLEQQKTSLDDFLAFLPQRFEPPSQDTDGDDYGSAPRETWGEKEDDHGDNEGEEGLTKAQSADNDELPPTPMQSLTKQIISRSMYFLTHESPTIRARILNLLTSAVPVLPGSTLLPSIHSAWPFILNRLGDHETFVVTAAAALIEALSNHVGDFMFRRVWDDVWPKYGAMLLDLEKGEKANALTRAGGRGFGSGSAYTHSHRLYQSLLRTMMFALKGVHEHEPSFWEVIMSFRRFLAIQMQEELQRCAVDLYIQAGKTNPDAVWLLLASTMEANGPVVGFMARPDWNVDQNAAIVLQSLG